MSTLGQIVRVLILAALSVMFIGWVFMLALGAAHSYEPVVPALGYPASIWVALALRVAASDAINR